MALVQSPVKQDHAQKRWSPFKDRVTRTTRCHNQDRIVLAQTRKTLIFKKHFGKQMTLYYAVEY